MTILFSIYKHFLIQGVNYIIQKSLNADKSLFNTLRDTANRYRFGYNLFSPLPSARKENLEIADKQRNELKKLQYSLIQITESTSNAASETLIQNCLTAIEELSKMPSVGKTRYVEIEVDLFRLREWGRNIYKKLSDFNLFEEDEYYSEIHMQELLHMLINLQEEEQQLIKKQIKTHMASQQQLQQDIQQLQQLIIQLEKQDELNTQKKQDMIQILTNTQDQLKILEQKRIQPQEQEHVQEQEQVQVQVQEQVQEQLQALAQRTRAQLEEEEQKLNFTQKQLPIQQQKQQQLIMQKEQLRQEQTKMELELQWLAQTHPEDKQKTQEQMKTDQNKSQKSISCLLYYVARGIAHHLFDIYQNPFVDLQNAAINQTKEDQAIIIINRCEKAIKMIKHGKGSINAEKIQVKNHIELIQMKIKSVNEQYYYTLTSLYMNLFPDRLQENLALALSEIENSLVLIPDDQNEFGFNNITIL